MQARIITDTVIDDAMSLPPCPLTLRRYPDGRMEIYDRLRAKYVALTPEERVRQCFTAYMIDTLGYPSHLMANEVGLVHNGVRRRCDTLIYDKSATPIAIIEYKAPSVSITEKVFDQIVRYNMVLGVKCLMVSNGLQHYCCRVEPDGRSYRFLRSIPTWQELAI